MHHAAWGSMQIIAIAASGTSFASPFVAGIAALIREADPTKGPGAVYQILRDTAKPWGPGGTPNEVAGIGGGDDRRHRADDHPGREDLPGGDPDDRKEADLQGDLPLDPLRVRVARGIGPAFPVWLLALVVLWCPSCGEPVGSGAVGGPLFVVDHLTY